MDAMAAATVSRARIAVSQRVRAFLHTHRLPVVLFAVAFLVRFVYLLDAARSPFFQIHIADALYHEEWARRILNGDLASLAMPGVLYKAPLYPYFIAFIYLLTGKNDFILMLVHVVLGALSALLLFRIGKRTLGATAAFIGGLLYALYFPSIYFSTEMEIPTLAIFLTLLAFDLLLSSRRARSLVASAVVFGLSLLALPTNLLLLPLHLALLWKAGKRGLARAGLYTALVLATIAPCTLRNLVAGKRLVLISANGGINFSIGNNANYDETVSLQPGYAFEELYDEPRRVAGASTFADRDRYWYGKTLGFVAAHPGQAALLIGKKLVLYFADYEIYRNTDTYYAKASSIYRNIPLVPASLLLAPGLVGLFLAIRRRKGVELALLCGLLALPCLLFFVTDRYRLPSMGIWALFAGYAVTSIAEWRRAWRPAGAAIAVATGLTIVSNLNLFVVKNPAYRPHFNLGFIFETQAKYDRALAEYGTALRMVQPLRDARLESELHARLGNVHMLANDLTAARREFEQAIAVHPQSVPAYSYLGTLFEKEKQPDLAVEMFERALAHNPDDVVTLHNLGLHYLNHDQVDEALARFARVLELAPEHAGAHNNLAYIYGLQGKLDRMETEAKLAIHYHPEGAQARYNLASLYLNTGRNEQAIAQYQAITRMAPREASNAYNQLGVIAAQKNDLPQAIDQWQQALAIDPSNPDASANLARARAMVR
jgi:tetratricopeptide (TPR) repeat protein